MFRNKLSIIAFTVSFILTALGVLSVRGVSPSNAPSFISITGELLVIAAANILFLLFQRKAVFESSSTAKRLKRFGWSGLLIFFFILGVAGLYEPAESGAGISGTGAFDTGVIASAIVVFAALLLSMFILVQLYGFVLIRRRKRTKNVFWLFYGTLLAYIFISIITRTDFLAGGMDTPESFSDVIAAITGIAAVFMMVLNSYRTAWVNYLNKRQKLACFFGSLALFISILSAGQYSGGASPVIGAGSLAAEIYFNTVQYFLLVYLFISVLSLLLHLPTAGIFDRKMQQLTSFYNISSAITTMLKFDKLLQMTTHQTLEVVDADSSWIMMKQPDGGEFELAASSNVPASLLKIIRSREFGSISAEIADRRAPGIYNTFHQYGSIKFDRSTIRFGSSLVGVPLVSKKRGMLGILFAYKGQDYAFDQEDSRMIEAFGNQTMIAIENSMLLDESIEKERLQQELNVARDIQLKLLPKSIPDIADNVVVEAVSIPAYEVGGDYYDFIELGPGRWGVFIGDVSGKSVSAALYMAEIKGFIQALARLYDSPKELLKKVNETLFTNIDRKSFISLLAAVIDLNAGTVVFTRAGHAPLGYCPPGSNEWTFLQPKGLGLGLDRGGIFNKIIEEQSIDFRPGTDLFFYTDGVTEVFDDSGEEFSIERLREVLDHCRKNGAEKYSSVVLDEIRRFSEKTQPDDITMIVIRYLDENSSAD